LSGLSGGLLIKTVADRKRGSLGEYKKQIMNTGKWFPVHRVILEQLQCVNTSLYLHYLIDQHDRWADEKRLVDGEWFYWTLDEASKKLGIKKHSLRNAKRRLKELGLVRFTQMPCWDKSKGWREHVKIDMPKVMRLMNGGADTAHTNARLEGGNESNTPGDNEFDILPPIESNAPNNNLYTNNKENNAFTSLSSSSLTLRVKKKSERDAVKESAGADCPYAPAFGPHSGTAPSYEDKDIDLPPLPDNISERPLRPDDDLDPDEVEKIILASLQS